MNTKELTRHYKWVMKKTAVEVILEHKCLNRLAIRDHSYQVRVSDGYGLVVRLLFDISEDDSIKLYEIFVYVDYMGHDPILSIKNFDLEWQEKIKDIILTWI